MSDYGIFESVSTDGLEEETRLRSAQRSFDRAVFAAKEEFGVFLGAAESRADFDNRLALVKRDLIATIHAAGIDPVTGVVRKIAKTMRPDFSKKASRRTAGDPGNPQVTGTPPVGSCPSCGLSTGWTGTECAMCGYREASRTAGSEWGEGFEDGPTGLDRDDEDDSGSDEAEDDPSWKSSGRKVSHRKAAFAPGDKVVDTAWGGLLDDQPGTVVSVDGDQVTVDWSPHGIQETHPASELRQALRKTAEESREEKAVDLVNEGDWKGYLEEVAPDAMESAEKNFVPGEKSKESGRKQAISDNTEWEEYDPDNPDDAGWAEMDQWLTQMQTDPARGQEQRDWERQQTDTYNQNAYDEFRDVPVNASRRKQASPELVNNFISWAEQNGYDPGDPSSIDLYRAERQDLPDYVWADFDREVAEHFGDQDALDAFRPDPEPLDEGSGSSYLNSSRTKTADDWKYDQAFQKFLLDLYGTTHGLTEDEIIEALEAYAGVGRPAEVIGTDPVAPTPPVPVGLASREKTAAPEWSLWPGGAGEWTGLETSDGKYMAEVHLYGDAGPSGGMGTGAVEWTISEIGPGSFDFKEVERSTKEYYKVPEAQADATEALKKYGPVGA